MARAWFRGHLVVFVAILAVVGCGGQSSSSGGSGNERGGSGNERGGSSAGGSSSGTPTSGRGGTAAGGSSSGGAPGGASGTGTGGLGGATDLIVLEDPNNYTAAKELSIPTIETAPGDVTVCWTEVTTDLACDEVDPESDVGAIGLLRFPTGSQEAIVDLMNTGELDMSLLDGYIQHETARASTCTELSSLSNFGVLVDPADYYVADENKSYLLAATRGTEPGFGDVSMVFARPVSSSRNRTVDFPPGCGLETFLADLEAADPVRVPYTTPGLVDYGNLTRDCFGNRLERGELDSLTLSHFAGASLSLLEEMIVGLDFIATQRYELGLEPSGGTTVSLYDAVSPETGESFPGFSPADVGVWLLRLTCRECRRRIPEVAVVIEPF